MSLVKTILKAIFPRKVLKQAFLVYNKIKIATFDRLFFPKLQLEKKDFIEHQVKNPFLELNMDISGYPKTIQDGLSLWIDPEWTQDQYIYLHKEPGYIEPYMGWALTKNKKLIYPSLGFASAPHVHKPDFFQTYFPKGTNTKLGRIVSLRDTGEENYFHFFNDVLAKVFFLQERNIQMEDYTFVVSEKLFNKPYFQFFLNRPPLSEICFHVQKENEWLTFEKALFCKPYTHAKEFFDKAVVIAKNRLGERSLKLFLTRSRSSLRFVENMEELEPVLKQCGFEIVDTSGMSFEDQISLFSKCTHLIGVHGAGLTNMIFAKDYPVKVLELVHPGPYIPFHYMMMARIYNFSYDVMQGSYGAEKNEGGFMINAEEFASKLRMMTSGDA